MRTSLIQSARIALSVVRNEGLTALMDRLRDQSAERLRLSRLSAPQSMELPAIPVINLSPLPPHPNRGGSQLQMLDRLDAESRQRPVALLYPTPRGWYLEARQESQGWRRLLPADPHSPVMSASGVAAAAQWAAKLCQSSILHLENLHGLPLDSVASVATTGLEVILSVHDFSGFCRRPHLLQRPAMKFCDFSRDHDRCRLCLAADWKVAPGDQERYRSEAASALNSAAKVIFPSSYLAESYQSLFPEVALPQKSAVVEPATLRATFPIREMRTAHVAFVGGAKPHKGGKLLADIAKGVHDLRDGTLFSSFGEGDADLLRHLRRTAGIRIHGYYRAGDLGRRLTAADVAVAVFPSIWPESYGLVVDECLAARIPVVAFAHGAPGLRIEGLGCGRTVPIADGPEGIARAVDGLLIEPCLVTDEVIRSLPTPESMAAALRSVYDAVESV